MSAGDVGAERDVQAGANSDPRSKIGENVYCGIDNINYFTKRTVPKVKNNILQKDRPQRKIKIKLRKKSL